MDRRSVTACHCTGPTTDIKPGDEPTYKSSTPHIDHTTSTSATLDVTVRSLQHHVRNHQTNEIIMKLSTVSALAALFGSSLTLAAPTDAGAVSHNCYETPETRS